MRLYILRLKAFIGLVGRISELCKPWYISAQESKKILILSHYQIEFFNSEFLESVPLIYPFPGSKNANCIGDLRLRKYSFPGNIFSPTLGFRKDSYSLDVIPTSCIGKQLVDPGVTILIKELVYPRFQF